MTTPCSARSTAFTLEVPMSIPRYRRRAPTGGQPLDGSGIRAGVSIQLAALRRVSLRRLSEGSLCNGKWPRLPGLAHRFTVYGTLQVDRSYSPSSCSALGHFSAQGAISAMSKTAATVTITLGPRAAGATLLRWLYDEIRLAIVEGRLSPGARLPSTRSIARRYGVARGTVVAAFDHLIAEGY